MHDDTSAETAVSKRDGSMEVHRRGALAIGAATAVGAGLGVSTIPAAAQDDGDEQAELYVAALTGDQQTTDIDTVAAGGAVVSANGDRSELQYAVLVTAIEDATQAHIHLGAAGEDGPVAVWLYPGPDATEPGLEEGRYDGILATGTITEEHLTEEVEGQRLDALVDRIASGDTYVNVHTEANPGGEIRGQLLSVTDVVDMLSGTDMDDAAGGDGQDDDASGDSDGDGNESVGDDDQDGDGDGNESATGDESGGNESGDDGGYGD
ncbi:CHRD domain-containing protein [Halovivax cerinus]|uniref:CHRD domain-containing protein n=1 Tax=Halovivax cerinus TaxID=1487865 RepID=A0ABD5NKI0_9EURY|nr:CHRD domain-containing protein [Halovivax cerinus]